GGEGDREAVEGAAAAATALLSSGQKAAPRTGAHAGPSAGDEGRRPPLTPPALRATSPFATRTGRKGGGGVAALPARLGAGAANRVAGVLLGQLFLHAPLAAGHADPLARGQPAGGPRRGAADALVQIGGLLGRLSGDGVRFGDHLDLGLGPGLFGGGRLFLGDGGGRRAEHGEGRRD